MLLAVKIFCLRLSSLRFSINSTVIFESTLEIGMLLFDVFDSESGHVGKSITIIEVILGNFMHLTTVTTFIAWLLGTCQFKQAVRTVSHVTIFLDVPLSPTIDFLLFFFGQTMLQFVIQFPSEHFFINQKHFLFL